MVGVELKGLPVGVDRLLEPAPIERLLGPGLIGATPDRSSTGADCLRRLSPVRK